VIVAEHTSAASADVGPNRRPRSDLGQTATEFAGVMTAVAVIFAALLALNPSMARDVSESLRTAVCRALHMSCGNAKPLAGPNIPCLVTQNTGTRKLGIKIAIVKIGGTDTLIQETYSDGSVRLTAITNGELGATVGAPEGELKVNLGKSAFGVGWNADLTAAANVEAAQSWFFPNQAAADKFTQQVSDQVASDRRWSLNPIGFIPGISGNTFGDASQWAGAANEIHPPTTVYVKAGANVTGSAGAYGGPAYVAGKAQIRGYTGTLFNLQNGQQTSFFEVGGNLEAGGGIFTLAGKGTGDANVQVAVTSDANGNPLSAKVVVTGKGSLSQLAGLNAKTLPDGVLGALKKANLGSTDNGMFQLTATLPLDDPQIQQQLADVLSGDLSQLPNLANTIDNRATVTANTYTGTGSAFGLEGEVGAGLVVGGNASYDTSKLTLNSASYYDPASGGFVPWTNCKP
jgi:hypothetical protein